MKITKISLWQIDLPMREGAYSWASQSFAAFDSTVVAIETDSGLSGYGEVCPLGPAYLAAYAQGARTGIATMAPGLISEDPRDIDVVYQKMNNLLKGHPYAKSAIDMACWDLLGKAAGLPVYTLLGGRVRDKVKLFKVISKAAPSQMADKLLEYRALGFDQFQMKVGGEPALDIQRIQSVAGALASHEVLAADANTGWHQHEAMRVAAAASDTGIYLEQPCLKYEECLAVRRLCRLPMILDECMDDLDRIILACRDGAMDVMNLKISRFGGLTPARQARDLCASMGIAVTIEDTWGGEIATAAIAHLSHSAAPGMHFQSSAFTEYNSVCIASGGAQLKDGYMSVADAPGLGVEPDFSLLGKPLFSCEG